MNKNVNAVFSGIGLLTQVFYLMLLTFGLDT